jgi:hypothetical protein
VPIGRFTARRIIPLLACRASVRHSARHSRSVRSSRSRSHQSECRIAKSRAIVRAMRRLASRVASRGHSIDGLPRPTRTHRRVPARHGPARGRDSSLSPRPSPAVITRGQRTILQRYRRSRAIRRANGATRTFVFSAEQGTATYTVPIWPDRPASYPAGRRGPSLSRRTSYVSVVQKMPAATPRQGPLAGHDDGADRALSVILVSWPHATSVLPPITAAAHVACAASKRSPR